MKKGLGKKLNFKVGNEGYDLIPGEESKFGDGRGSL